jgi:hypothetical protein
MSEHPVEVYKAAVNKFLSAETKLNAMIALIHEAASALRKPNAVYFSGFSSRSTLTSSAVTVSLEKWPTGKDLADAVHEFQAAYVAAKEARNALPPADRNRVEPRLPNHG